MNITKEKTFADYYGVCNSLELVKAKEIYNDEKWLKTRKIETALIAKLIKESIDVNKITEFSDTFYVDYNTMYPTISQAFATGGYEAELLTPNLRNITIDDMIVTNVPKNNIYGNYSEFNSFNTEKIIYPECFVSEKQFSRLTEHYKIWALKNIPCVFAVSGQLNNNTKAKDEQAKLLVNEIIHNEDLTADVNFKYVRDTNSFAKIYTIKKKY